MTQNPSAKNTRFSKSRLAFAIAAQMLTYGNALAGPSGGEVVGGVGSIEQQGTETTITQASDKMAIDWQSFDVAKDERVTFVQPGQSAVALNRILSNNGSEILGQIDANGHVILVNPHGVVFGEGAVVNAGGLIASGLQINPDDFMNGDLVFKRIEGTDGTVINAGMINAASGGNVALIGTQVENRGLISARLGSVILASGKEAVLTFDESGLLGLQVDEAILQSELGDKAAISNSGELKAEGGRILLSASTTRDVFSQAVNWGDQKQARSVTYNEDGSFTLGAGGDVVNTGEITVSGETAGNIVALGENITSTGKIRADATQEFGGNVELHSNTTTIISEQGIVTANAKQGGDIKVLGKNVGLFDSSSVEATGENGGGRILVGGDREGLNHQIRNADFVYINEKASINASATNAGDGGRAIVFAEDTARIHGNLSARGGESEGNGGFVETSGKKSFSITASPDVSAIDGVAGSWLIDPYDLRVGDGGRGALDDDNAFESGPNTSTISAELISNALDSGADVTLRTGSSGSQQGNITVSRSIRMTGSEEASLNLIAHNEIRIEQNIIAERSPDRKLNVNLNAGGDVILGNGVNIETSGGDFFIGKINSEGEVEAGAHNVTFERDAVVNVKGSYSETELGEVFSHANGFTTGLGPSGRVVINAGGDVKFRNIQVGGRERVGDPAKIDIKAVGDIELSQRWQYDNNATEEFLDDPDLNEGKGYTTTRLTAGGDIRFDGSVVLEYPTEENPAHQDRMHFILESGGEVRLGDGVEINTSSGDFIVNNASFLNFRGAINTRSLSGESGAITLKSEGLLELPSIDTAGDLNVFAKGNITQQNNSRLKVTGQTIFSLEGGNLTVNKQDNVFSSLVTVDGAEDVYLATSEDLELGGKEGEIIAIGKLDVSAKNIKQSGAVKVTGEAVLSASEDITFNAENQLSSLRIKSAKIAKINNSQDLRLTGVQDANRLEISVAGSLGQSSTLSVDQLILNVSGITSLGQIGNRISGLAGTIAGGQISAGDTLKLGEFNQDQLRLTGATTISARQMNVDDQVLLAENALLTLDGVGTFTLSRGFRGEDPTVNSVTVNGRESNGTYIVSQNASWEGVKLIFNGAGGADTLIIEKAGPISVGLSADAIANELPEHSLAALNIETIEARSGTSNTLIGASSASSGYEWNINGRGEGSVKDLDTDQQVGFRNFDVLEGGAKSDQFKMNNRASMTAIRGGGGEDTLDYSNREGLLNITIGEKQDGFEEIKDIEILVGNGADATLQAPDAINTWLIDDAENSVIKSAGGQPGDEELPANEEPPESQMKFRNFGRLKGGGQADTFLVNLDGRAVQYTLEGGGGSDVLEFLGGGDRWLGTYKIDNSSPSFSFVSPTDVSANFTYADIESIQLNANLDLMTLTGSSGSDTFFLGPQYWQWNTSPRIAFSQLQRLRVEAGSSETIDLTGTINLPESLELHGGRLRINSQAILKTNRLILAEIDEVDPTDARLKIAVNSLTLKDNRTALYLEEEEGLELAGLSGESLVNLKILQGDLTQSNGEGAGPINSRGVLQLEAVAGAIRLDRRDNEISGPITITAGTEATVYASSNLELAGVNAPYLSLETTGSISSAVAVVADEAHFVSGDDVRLSSIENDFYWVIANVAGDVDLTDVGDLVLFESRIGGDLSLRSDWIAFDGSITVNEDAFLEADEVGFWGATSIGRDLTLNADLVGFFGETTSGTLKTDANFITVEGMVIIIGDYDFGDALITGGGVIRTINGEIQAKSKFTGLERMIEVESLADIDPAIFTDVKNYFYQDVSIQLPSDQLYEQQAQDKPLAGVGDF